MTTRGKKYKYDDYNNGDRVIFVGGKFKGFSGTYCGKYGKVMCSILVDGETKSRNVWLSSVTKAPNKEHDMAHEQQNDDTADTPNKKEMKEKKKDEMEKLIMKIENMKVQLDVIRSTLQQLVDEEE